MATLLKKCKDKIIAGTTPMYQRHIVLLDPANKPEEWPAKIEADPTSQLHQYTQFEKQWNQEGCPIRVKYNVSHAPVDIYASGHSVLVYPDMIKLNNIQPDAVKGLTKQFAFSEKLDDLVPNNVGVERLHGRHLLVCVHGKRDCRCGEAGPKLIQWFRDLSKKSKDRPEIFPVSHIGGHRFAATCISYPDGNWYGNVNTSEAAEVVLQVSTEEASVSSFVYGLWRGKMGMTKQDQLDEVSNY